MQDDKSNMSVEQVSPVSSAFSREQSLVFISHDTRDAELAEAFSRLLSSVSAGVLKSFRSSDRKGTQGIEYGVEWFPEIMSKLNNASDVVCLLTKRSIDRPWILYEAGVAKGKLETPVYGLALGIPLNLASSGPFAQFQNTSDDVESITKLVMQLLRRIPNAEPDYDAVQMQVQSFTEKVKQILARLEGGNEIVPTEQQVDEESVAKIFEEVKVMFQDLPSRIDGRINAVVNLPPRQRTRRIHPRIFDEIMYGAQAGKVEPLMFLILISQTREEFPWIYEVGIELYHALKSGRPSHIARSVKNLENAIRMTFDSSIWREPSTNYKETIRMIEELLMFVTNYRHSLTSPQEKTTNSSEEE